MSNDNQIDSLTVGVGLDSSDFKRGQQEIDSGLDQIEKVPMTPPIALITLATKRGKQAKN